MLIEEKCEWPTLCNRIELLLVGPPREVRAAHPTVSIRVVVGDLSLHRFGGHNVVAQELEGASTCMASKLMQAGCEIATKKSKVLSNSVFVRTKLQARVQPLGVQATRTERNLCHRACHAQQENPWQIVGAMAAEGGADCACFGGESKPLRGGSHRAQ